MASTLNPPSSKINIEILRFANSILSEPKIKKLTSSNIVTVIDFSLNSAHKRLWVVNIKSDKVIYRALVANGINPFHFSNKPHSHESSIGIYLTESVYYGKHGLSLKLKGIDGKFNNNAESRHIVMHKARYASINFAHLHHKLGKSWGCFAVEPKLSRTIIEYIKGGTILIAYFPKKEWFKDSPYIYPNTPKIK
ncbi:murein L,D-transpeptidase catalytic domain family protein [uncultured Shewanella sp.]|uniref:murein L,D-transpeptidase catalytic domain family protein n=1 Tax=uncultured Shewanella sp. TaxID=173975 RepID=UPI0026068472|nr:murein L,D-transpeptidase catalytic domain family protein [uncultured Shewanella sp.]